MDNQPCPGSRVGYVPPPGDLAWDRVGSGRPGVGGGADQAEGQAGWAGAFGQDPGHAGSVAAREQGRGGGQDHGGDHQDAQAGLVQELPGRRAEGVAKEQVGLEEQAACRAPGPAGPSPLAARNSAAVPATATTSSRARPATAAAPRPTPAPPAAAASGRWAPGPAPRPPWPPAAQAAQAPRRHSGPRPGPPQATARHPSHRPFAREATAVQRRHMMTRWRSPTSGVVFSPAPRPTCCTPSASAMRCCVTRSGTGGGRSTGTVSGGCVLGRVRSWSGS